MGLVVTPPTNKSNLEELPKKSNELDNFYPRRTSGVIKEFNSDEDSKFNEYLSKTNFSKDNNSDFKDTDFEEILKTNQDKEGTLIKNKFFKNKKNKK